MGRQVLDKEWERRIDGVLERNNYQVYKQYVRYLLSTKTPSTAKQYLVAAINLVSTYIDNPKNSKEIISKTAGLTSVDLSEYIKSFKYSADGKRMTDATLRARHYEVKAWYSYLEYEGYIEEMKNPCRRLRTPKISDVVERETLTVEEIKKLFSFLDKKYSGIEYWFAYELFDIALTFGLRVSALRGLDVNSFDLDKKEFTAVEKGDVARTYSLSDKQVETIKTYLSYRNSFVRRYGTRTDAFFINVSPNAGDDIIAERISYPSISRFIKRTTKQIGKELSPHDLRATSCSLFYATHDHDLVATKNFMRHASANTTVRYIYDSVVLRNELF